MSVSVRSAIIAEIKKRLETAGFFVSRKILKLKDLRTDQIPGVSILNGPQSDQPGSQDDDVLAQWRLSLVVYEQDQKEEDPQGKLDESMALVARTLFKGRDLSELVYTIDSDSRDTDRGTYFPFASAEMIFRIKFFYDRETQGG